MEEKALPGTTLLQILQVLFPMNIIILRPGRHLWCLWFFHSSRSQLISQHDLELRVQGIPGIPLVPEVVLYSLALLTESIPQGLLLLPVPRYSHAFLTDIALGDMAHSQKWWSWEYGTCHRAREECQLGDNPGPDSRRGSQGKLSHTSWQRLRFAQILRAEWYLHQGFQG